MVIEQLLKDWIVERGTAADLTVAARSAKAIAQEIEGHYHDIVARTEAVGIEKSQQLSEKERSLDKALELMTRLEGQVALLRDKGDRQLAERDVMVAEKDRVIEAQVQAIARLETQFAQVNERLEARIGLLDQEMAEKGRSLQAREESIARLERDLEARTATIETYRQKFGKIMKAVE